MSTRPPGTVRLQRLMADAGVASRRACEAIILAGRVKVNGRVCSDLPVLVDPARDRVLVDGRLLSSWTESETGDSSSRRGTATTTGENSGLTDGPVRARRVYVMVFKTARMLTTTHDDAGRPTVMDLVKHPSGVRLFPVGRLDFESTGLILLTNDGELTHRLTHAKYGIEKVYEVVVKGVLTPETLAVVRAKLSLRPTDGAADREKSRGGGPFVSLDVIDADATRSILRLVVRGSERSRVRVRDSRATASGFRAPADGTRSRGGERWAGGREDEGSGGSGAGGGGLVREVLGRLGHPVKKIVRVGLGPVELTDIGAGQWRELTRDEVKALRRSVGLSGGDRRARGGAARRATGSGAS